MKDLLFRCSELGLICNGKFGLTEIQQKNLDELKVDIEEVMRLDDKSYIEFIEKSLNLNESIIVELRRMFYIFVKYGSSNEVGEINKDKKFCHKNPKKCILSLLESIKVLEFDNVESLEKIIHEINIEIDYREGIRETPFIRISDTSDDPSAKIDAWVDYFIETYKYIFK